MLKSLRKSDKVMYKTETIEVVIKRKKKVVAKPPAVPKVEPIEIDKTKKAE